MSTSRTFAAFAPPRGRQGHHDSRGRYEGCGDSVVVAAAGVAREAEEGIVIVVGVVVGERREQAEEANERLHALRQEVPARADSAAPWQRQQVMICDSLWFGIPI